MSTRLHRSAAAALFAPVLWLALPQPASAARVLFVSDDGSDLAIADVLRMDGHDVTTVGRDFSGGLNPSLHPDLSSYDCVVWSATSDATGANHTDSAAFANLLDFATNGGNVFVTGYGSVGFDDMRLVTFLGGTGGTSFTGGPQQIADLDTNLTTGIVDIRNVIPNSFGRFEYEALTGLGDDTVRIAGALTTPDGAQWSIRTVGSGHIAWVAGLEDSNAEWLSTAAGSSGAFTAAVRNFVAASTGTASAPGAPRVAFSAPFSALEGAALTINAHVTDVEGDTVTFTWDLDGDGNFGEQPNVDTVMVPEGVTDGPGGFSVSVEASDGTHTTRRSRSIAIVNVAPTSSAHPPMTAAIDQHVRYALGIVDPGGSHDPLTYTLQTSPGTATVTSDGVFDWTVTEADITAMGASHPVAVQVDDGDGGMLTLTWSMMVIADHAPTDPLLLYPAMDSPLLISGIHMAVGNSSDLDGDPITYTFELASTSSFDTNLQTSVPLPGTATGITQWSPDESQLHYGRWYWRVSASDGHVSTSPNVASFLLVPDPTMFPDVGTLDAGPDAGSVVATPRGCAIGPHHANVGSLATISALIGLVLARCRLRGRPRR